MFAVIDDGLQLGVHSHHLGVLLPAYCILVDVYLLLLAELPALQLDLAGLVGLHEVQSLHAGAVLVLLDGLLDAAEAGPEGQVVLLGLSSEYLGLSQFELCLCVGVCLERVVAVGGGGGWPGPALALGFSCEHNSFIITNQLPCRTN